VYGKYFKENTKPLPNAEDTTVLSEFIWNLVINILTYLPRLNRIRLNSTVGSLLENGDNTVHSDIGLHITSLVAPSKQLGIAV